MRQLRHACGALLLAVALPAAAQQAAPADPEELNRAAGENAARGETELARSLWQKAIDASPEFFPALYNLGYSYVQAEQYGRARPYLARAAEVAPDHFYSVFLLGLANQNLGLGDDALRAWRRALEIRPDDVRLMQIMAGEYGRGRYYREAAALAVRTLALHPDDINLYFLAINAWRDAGDHDEATRLAAEVAGKFPTSAIANFEYAYQLQRAHRFEEGLVYMGKALQIDPNYDEPLFYYGQVLVELGRHREAIPYLERAIAANAAHVIARCTLGRAYIGLQQWDHALAALLGAVRADPKSPQPHLLLSQLYFRMGEEDKARQEKAETLRLRRELLATQPVMQGRPFPE